MKHETDQWQRQSPFTNSPSPRSLAVHQPIHSSLRPILDPEYVSFHDQYLQYIVPDEQKPWNITARLQPSLPQAGTMPTRVGMVRDLQLENCQLRLFVPESSQPVAKYPVLLWLHGGGWTLGDLNSDNDFLTYICQASQCIVVTVDYRLAPEHPYPAAAEDAIEAYQWLIKDAPNLYDIDITRIAIGGTSAGGNLAAVLVLEVACLFPHSKPSFMLLIVPVIDNTATPGQGWYNTKAPWLTPARLLWYRKMYMPNGHGLDAKSEREEWQMSPNLAQSKLLSKCPPTWIAVAEHDLLATEALAFSNQLLAAKVRVQTKVYQGCPHPILSLNGVLSKGRELFLDAAQALNGAFWPMRLDPLLGWTLCA